MATCISDYLTDNSSECALLLPEEGNVLTPFVTVTFGKSGETITVGNQSSPGTNNHAVIKDFEFGFSDGWHCRLTVIDEGGSSFFNFCQDLIKDYRCLVSDKAVTMTINFGWIKAYCPGGNVTNKTSPTYNFLCQKIETNFSNGRFMFLIHGTDLVSRMPEGVHEWPHGDEQNEQYMTDAIRQMFTDSRFPPTVSDVKFWAANPGSSSTSSAGGTVPNVSNIKWRFGDSQKGLKGTWRPSGRNKLQAALAWLRSNRTINDKGIFPVYGEENGKPILIFWESPVAGCSGNVFYGAGCYGTYIVNSGKTSPVIEFNPKIEWDFRNLSVVGGAMSDGKVMINAGGKVIGVPGCKTLQRDRLQTAGLLQTVAAEPNMSDFDKQTGQDQQSLSQNAHLVAYNLWTNPVEGDLVLVGDPTFIHPNYAMLYTLQIIFLNPYNIFETDEQCGEWMATPTCNQILSNNAWRIKNVTHKVAEGRYTTTVGVVLGGPGMEFDTNEPLGGPGSSGPTFQTC